MHDNEMGSILYFLHGSAVSATGVFQETRRAIALVTIRVLSAHIRKRFRQIGRMPGYLN
jgi:hypothetical protein